MEVQTNEEKVLQGMEDLQLSEGSPMDISYDGSIFGNHGRKLLPIFDGRNWAFWKAQYDILTMKHRYDNKTLSWLIYESVTEEFQEQLKRRICGPFRNSVPELMIKLLDALRIPDEKELSEWAEELDLASKG
ncbi:hypothetical protein HMI55_003376 [Coelomomyces lativittatus]|nr:hypothetical protein HMI55_003376 [Coelomomyces lativittatus]